MTLAIFTDDWDAHCTRLNKFLSQMPPGSALGRLNELHPLLCVLTGNPRTGKSATVCEYCDAACSAILMGRTSGFSNSQGWPW
jgi:hypothetical protein